MSEDQTPRYTTKRLRDEIKKAEERGRQYALERFSISAVEILALKKLALVSGALANSLSDVTAAREQKTLTRVLIEVVNRWDASKSPTNPPALSE